MASGDLPEGVTVVGGYSLCGVLLTCIDEGRAMQIIHDVAPSADLLFYTDLGDVAGYASNIIKKHSRPSRFVKDFSGVEIR